MNEQQRAFSPQAKSDLLDKVCALVAKRLDGRETDMASRFVRHFFEDVPPGDLVQHDEEELYGLAVSYWQYLAKRPDDGPKIQVYNPTLEGHGWKSVHTIVEIVTDDSPFLIDSVTAELNRLGLTVHLVIHPIAAVKRDGKGNLVDFHEAEGPDDGYGQESWMLFQIDEQTGAAVLKEIRDGVAAVLADVRAAVEDWPGMMERGRAMLEELRANPPDLPEEEVEEGRAFLEWIMADNFTFLGYREYRIDAEGEHGRIEVDPGSGMGILRDPDFHVFEGTRDAARLPPDALAFLTEPRLLVVGKANKRATVHRPVHLDAVGYKMFDKAGAVIGECLFVGLFTSEVYYRSPFNIPYVRRKLEQVQELAGFRRGSHDAKALEHLLATYPRDELFQISVEDLHRIVIGILHLQERQRVAFFERRDPFQRFISALVFAPREGFSTELRHRFATVLARAYDGSISAFDTQLSQDLALARIHFIVKTTPGAVPTPDPLEVEANLAEAARSWSDRLRDELIERQGEEEGLRLTRRYHDAFPSNYREMVSPQSAMVDVEKVEAVIESGDLALNMYRPLEAEEGLFRFKVYNRGAPVPLSDVLPMLENMGVRVLDEVPYQVTPSGVSHVWIHDFGLKVDVGGELDLDAVRESFHESFTRAWHGDVENDGFNRLALGARLGWRQIVMLRAYAKYLRQTGVPFSQDYIQETLANNPDIVAWLVDLFESRFAPPRAKGEKVLDEIAHQIDAALEDVTSLDEDRIIRRYVNLIQSTIRTNYYQRAEEGGPKPHLSFKIDSHAVEGLPKPRPLYEIWVYSPRVEGVHLRFGKVARGGLRWSDRREDFRTEILGLAKAQVVKNAVIVPVGSKGGFVVKRPPAGGDRAALQEEGIACYKTFIRGMLDVTDNLKAGEIIPPRDVARHDDDDPYLVVAADKGTATFSDIANEVSAEYGFWLDDAFASGGSAGYDHKEMGITARGGWEAVKRHFREMGKNIQEEDFTVIGVGDMSGDVFGNGMLLSKHIRLIGAFNHLHVFVDPDPDPAKSWEERKRLFDAGRGSWNDYDTALISEGGGVFSRAAKSIDVTPQMKQLFGLTASRVTPNELINAILKSEVELLWFGGIGTYVKASHESHAEVGDRINDSLRVDARELKAKVIGEGANLGMTQRSRIEFALQGGRLNTDAIDNSAGVDCSDHEVNIKILLRDVLDSGDMTMKQRNTLLEKMTEEVAGLVLRDNYLQTGCITVTEAIAPGLLDRHVRFMRALEREGRLDRAVEFLPDEETIEERQTAGLGLTRPEIAVLLAYAKINLFDQIIGSDLPDDPALAADLIGYFPEPLRKKHRKAAERHRLRREIIATRVTNDLVNRAGITFIHDIAAETGDPAEDIARAYIIAREALSLKEIWLGVEALDNQVPAEIQTKVFHRTGQLVKRMTGWFLRNGRKPLDIKAEIDAYKPGLEAFREALGGEEMLPNAGRELLARRCTGFAEAGLPEELAQRAGGFEFLLSGCDVVGLAQRAGVDLITAGSVYFRIGDALAFNWLRDAATAIPPDNYWDKMAISALIDELYSHQAALTESALATTEPKGPGAGGIFDAWFGEHRQQIDRTYSLIDDIRGSGTPDLAMIAVANRQIRALRG